MGIGLRAATEPGVVWTMFAEKLPTWSDCHAKSLTWEEIHNYKQINWELSDSITMPFERGRPILVQVGAYGIETAEKTIEDIVLAYDPAVVTPYMDCWTKQDQFGLKVDATPQPDINVSAKSANEIVITFKNDQMPEHRWSGNIALIAFHPVDMQTAGTTTITLK